MSVTTEEITRAAPDIICVRVHDEDFTKYPLVELDTVDPSHPTTAWVSRTNPHTAASEPCRVVGDGTWLRFGPKVPTNFLDRDAADIYTNYPSLGGVAPIAVYRKSYAHHQGENDFAATGRSINCRHEMFVVYASTVPDGNYTMSITGNAFPAKTFTVGEKTIRSDTIRSTQTFQKPTDPEKIAALSVWIPGKDTEGQQDLDTDYSVTGDNFYIINEAGTEVFTGTPALRIGPTDQEGETGSEATLVTYPSNTTAAKACTSAVTRGNPTVFNMTSHGFSSAQTKWFSGFSGLDSAFNEVAYEITVIDPNSFSVAVDSTSYSVHGFETYLAGYDSLVFDTYQANRGNTYIYDLDYSAFVPTTGNFGKHRVYVPGFGVSHEFIIDPAGRFEIIKNSVKAYTSQCWGMSLSSGVAGWNRPANYRDGKRNQKVYESTKPGCADEEGGYYETTPFKIAGIAAAWQTNNRVTDWFGAFSDAGDHDYHIHRHTGALYHLLNTGFEYVKTGTNDLHFGFPKSSQTIDKALYGEIDSLADVIHMVIWYLEPFRRHQHADGWVYSGCQYSSGAQTSEFSPTWIATDDMYLLAADHQSGFIYAWIAAKLGRILKDEGFTTLGDMWIDSAEDCFNWCDAIWEDWNTAGIASTGAWKDWYIDTLDIKTSGGFSDAELTAEFNGQNEAINDKSSQTKGHRLVASTTLWRAKGGTASPGSGGEYNDFILAAGSIQKSGVDNFAIWEYVKGPDLGDNAVVLADLSSTLNSRPEAKNAGQLEDTYCYRNIATENDNNNIQPRSAAHEEIWAWHESQPAGDFDKWIKLICAAEDYVGGRNQQGMCFTTGIGANPPDPILHRDQEWANIDPTPGYTIYVRFGPVGTARFANLSVESVNNYTIMYPTTSAGVTQSIYPNYWSYPVHEQHIRNTFDIYSTEFVTQEQLVGRIVNNIVLHTWDGTGTTELVNAPISASLEF